MIQGLSGSMTKLAGIYLKEELLNLKLYNEIMIVNMVHDEIVLEVPNKHIKVASALISKCMERAGKAFCKTIPMVAEAVVTDYWKH